MTYQYKEIIPAKFINRPNRFIAEVLIDGKKEIVHIKNTGRNKEILVKGTTVYLEKATNPNRKTRYSLIAAMKGDMLINIDSQVTNAVVANALAVNKIKEITCCTKIKREYVYGNSRFDIYFEKDKTRGLIEVKGVTLEENGICMFPDAPTERGTKHVKEMIKAVKEGYEGYIFFLIQMQNMKLFKPNVEMDKKFSNILKEAYEKGVNILAYDTIVEPNKITLNNKIPIHIET